MIIVCSTNIRINSLFNLLARIAVIHRGGTEKQSYAEIYICFMNKVNKKSLRNSAPLFLCGEPRSVILNLFGIWCLVLGAFIINLPRINSINL